MKLLDIIFILIIGESLFNSDVYSFQNVFGVFFYLLLNILIFLGGVYSIHRNKNLATSSFTFFIVISILSSLYNQVSVMNLLEFILRYGKIYFTFFIGIELLTRYSEKEIYYTLSRLNIINFIFNCFFFLQIPIIPNKWIGSLDFATGILGDCLYQSFFSLIILGFSIIQISNRSFSKWYLMFNALIAFTQIVWANVFSFYVVILFAIPITLILTRSFKNALASITLSLFVVVYFFSFSDSGFYRESINTLLNSSPKIISYNDAFSGEYMNTMQELIGVGPGQGGSYISLKNKTTVAENYFNIYSYFTDAFRKGSITTLPNTGIITIKSEIGYFGLLNYILFFLALIKYLRKVSSKNLSSLNKISIYLIVVFFLENILADYLQHSIFPILTFLIIGYSIGKNYEN